MYCTSWNQLGNKLNAECMQSKIYISWKEKLQKVDHAEQVKIMTEGIKKLCESTLSHLSLSIASHPSNWPGWRGGQPLEPIILPDLPRLIIRILRRPLSGSPPRSRPPQATPHRSLRATRYLTSRMGPLDWHLRRVVSGHLVDVNCNCHV